MKKIQIAVLAAALVLASRPLFAHHGYAAAFDSTKVIKFSGKVNEFVWRNPHCRLVLDGTDETGKPITYTIELGSPGVLVKYGMTRNLFSPGSEVGMEVHASRTNPSFGVRIGKVWVDGKELPGAERAGAN